MDRKILVIYATKYGATAAIAERIAEVLNQSGLKAQAMPINQVDHLSGCGGVVLGSAVYMGKWRKEAAAFLEAQEKILSTMPVWLFSSGPTGEGDPVQIMKGWHFPIDLQPIADRIKPRDCVLFHGVLDMNRLSWFERVLVKGIKAPIGDFRDWDAITSWAESIAGVMNSC